MQHRHVDQFGGRVEVTERSAESSAIARLAMADIADRLADDRERGFDIGRKFKLALPRHRAEVAGTTVDPDERQRLDAIEIDEMIGRDHAKVEHRHQRLPSRKRNCIVEPADEFGGLVDGGWIMIGKGRWFHGVMVLNALCCCWPKLYRRTRSVPSRLTHHQ